LGLLRGSTVTSTCHAAQPLALAEVGAEARAAKNPWPLCRAPAGHVSHEWPMRWACGATLAVRPLRRCRLMPTHCCQHQAQARRDKDRSYKLVCGHPPIVTTRTGCDEPRINFQHVTERVRGRACLCIGVSSPFDPLVDEVAEQCDGKTTTERWRIVERPRDEDPQGARQGGNSNQPGGQEARTDCRCGPAEGDAGRNFLQSCEARRGASQEIARRAMFSRARLVCAAVPGNDSSAPSRRFVHRCRAA
jgi:hypothetical protein